MEKPKTNICPMLQSECIEHSCRWWIHATGQNQEGKPLENFGCAIEFIPLLLVENSGQQRHTSRAVESLRNEMIKNLNIPILLATAREQKKLPLD